MEPFALLRQLSIFSRWGHSSPEITSYVVPKPATLVERHFPINTVLKWRSSFKRIYFDQDKIYVHTYKEDTQCIYNVIAWRFHETIVAVEKKKILHIGGVCLRTCSFNYPACNAPPCCHLRPSCIQGIFSTLSDKRHDLRKKKLLNIKCVFFIFFSTFIWNNSD